VKTLALCLWKEWRDQRVVLLGLLAGTLLLFGMAKAVLPDKVLESSSFRDIALFSCLGLAVLVFASDLVCGEERRGHLRLLRRTPSGLLPVFLAKTAWMAGAVACLGAWGWLAAGLVSGIYASFPWVRLCTGVAVAAGAWGVAASCWLPRGALAVPAAGLVLGLLALPVYLSYERYPGLKPPPRAVEAFVVLLAAAAIPVGWLSFVRGKRFERGLWAGAWRGLLATFLVFVPAYGFTAVEVRNWHWVDPANERFTMTWGYLGPNHRYVYVNSYMARAYGFDPENAQTPAGGPNAALVLDLETGAWREVGMPNDVFCPAGASSTMWWEVRPTVPVKVVGRRDAAASRLDDKGLRTKRAWMHYHDAATTEVVKSGWSDMRHPEVDALGPRARSYVPAGYELVLPRGLGWSAWRGRKSYFYDPLRHRTYEPFPDLRHVLIRPGRWLARRDDTWVLFDPDTQEASPAPDPPKRIDWLLDDGRAVTGGEVWDPETGARQTIDRWAAYSWSEARTPDGGHIVGFQAGPDPRFRFARLDARTLDLRWFDGLRDIGFQHFRLIAVLDDETMIGIYKRTSLVRVRCGTAEREVLWPR